jgi:hypothetical protein
MSVDDVLILSAAAAAAEVRLGERVRLFGGLFHRDDPDRGDVFSVSKSALFELLLLLCAPPLRRGLLLTGEDMLADI